MARSFKLLFASASSVAIFHVRVASCIVITDLSLQKSDF